MDTGMAFEFQCVSNQDLVFFINLAIIKYVQERVSNNLGVKFEPFYRNLKH